MTLSLPSLHPVPDDISDIFTDLLHQPARPDGLGEWLLELIKSSGHLSLTDDIRWRVLATIWLAAEYDIEAAWPYLMWFNQGQPEIAEHLSDVLYDAVNDHLCHPQLAAWMTQTDDERLQAFFKPYQNTPSQTRLPQLIKRLLPQAKSPQVGTWLADYCETLSTNGSQYLRRWKLFTAVWYATCFDAPKGLTYLQAMTDGKSSLSLSDNKQLSDTTDEVNATPAVIQWIADCSHDEIKTMLKEFGHPNLDIFIELIFQHPPDFAHLKHSADHAPTDAHLFQQFVTLMKEARVNPTAKLLDLACGPLAPQTLMFASSGYDILGLDLHIPPAYWPVNFVQRLTRGKYIKGWKTATDSYYQALQQASGVQLNWRKVAIELADLTRLKQPSNQFEAVMCSQYLHHAPDVEGLISEAARLLKSGGTFMADIRPYPALTGAFLPPDAEPSWAHLRQAGFSTPPNIILNQWRETHYRACLEKHFTIEQWLTEQDDLAQSRLTPDIQAELADYSEAELTRRNIIVVCRKR